MARPVTWFRLYRGRVWHVRPGDTDDFATLAMCGQPHAAGEELLDRPPLGGKPCPECTQAVEQIAETARQALHEWARRQEPTLDAPVPDDVIEDEILDEDEVLADSGSVCACGHYDADHDIDTHECCAITHVTPDAFSTCTCERFEATALCQRCEHPTSAHNDDDGCTDLDDLGDACECHQVALSPLPL